MEIAYVLIAVAALLALYFLFGRKSEPKQLEQPARDKKLTAGARSIRPPKSEAPDEGIELQEDRSGKPPRRSQRPPPSRRGEVSPEPPVADDHRRPSVPHVRDVEGLRRGLARSRSDEGFFGKLRALIGGKKAISPDIASEIEEVLLASDVGVQTTQAMLERIRESLNKADLVDASRVWEALRAEAKRILDVDGSAGAFALRAKPTVVILVGVNGAGKTTTIGKLATKLVAGGNTCVLAAADTFRAAAVQQLVIWGDRVGCQVVKGKDGADPGSVVFEGIKKSRELGADVLLADTAGRLHTKTNLMAEMKKIVASAGKALEGAPHEVLLVIDATNGQNALAQAKEFKDALPLTGIVLTKLDGTAKGGIILGICDTLKLPVRFIGLGERPDDLHEFEPDDFVEALLGKESAASAA
jgi:fused signal recognition particle receptor